MSTTLLQEPKSATEQRDFDSLIEKFLDWWESVPDFAKRKEPAEVLILVFFSQMYREQFLQEVTA
jgi:hypothetical protein